MNIRNFALTYFRTFEEKNLESLSNMFDENVTLKDWNIYAEGRDAVVEANQNIFDSIESLTVEVQSLHIDRLTVVAEVIIKVPGEPDLPVVDVIRFTTIPSSKAEHEVCGGEFKIGSIVAYRGN